MSRKKILLKGTLILTMAGIITRLIGFAYRIFMSQTFTPEEIGLYQLIFPVYTMCYAFSTAGIQTAISKNVASKMALNQKEEAQHFLKISMLFSLLLSFICTYLLQHYGMEISTDFLQNPDAYPLLVIISYSFPFASLHSCIVGYHYGLKQTKMPALSQILEQVVRVLTVFGLYYFCLNNEIEYTISLAVIGLVIGEIVGALYSILYLNRKHSLVQMHLPHNTFFTHTKELFHLATPLTANRVTINLLHSVEALSIPLQLQAFGLSPSAALSTYGILMGMALPCILFPTAITSSFSSLLLPTVAESLAQNNKREIKQLIFKTAQYCILLGFICLISFILLSDIIGIYLFHNSEVGSFLKVLAWICPFLYLNSTLLAMINGLGKPMITFGLNGCSLLIRISCIYLLIPVWGIYGYLWGVLLSQLFILIGSAITFRKLCII